MKNLLSLAFISVLLFSICHAQKRTVVTGNVYDLSSKVKVSLYKITEKIDEDLSLTDGNFKVTFLLKEPTYFDFSVKGTKLREMLLEPGDSLVVGVDSLLRITWSGKGFEKNSYQTAAQRKFSDALNHSADLPITDEDDADSYAKHLDSSKAMQAAFLNKYKAKMSEMSYKILYADVWAAIELEKLMRLILMSNPKNRDEISKLYQRLEFNNAVKFIENDTIAYSQSYISYRATKSNLDYNFLYNMNGGHGWNFSNEYYLAKALSNGKVQERLLTGKLWFILKFYLDENTEQCVKDFLQSSKNEEYKNIIKTEFDFQKRFGIGRSAIDFTLPNSVGKKISLKQFKGKVVVLDFWHLYCPGCVSLFNSMQKVKSHYKDNKDVVFLNISTDDKITLIDGIKKYKLNDDINLYTEGSGWKHPIIENYGIVSHPKQFVIGKDGRFVSSSPTRADVDNGDGIIGIIDKVLK